MIPSVEQVAISAVAKRKASLKVAANADLEALPWPIPLNALMAVNDSRDLPECGPRSSPVERNQGVTQPS